ncbi:BppU family phage baseplate upper protein [Bacillus paramycoides]|uniref:BppU family phage baseplate upper protein n=1 Tax=Bacillus paramycoides TaxID=2026194 RepID=UPI003D0192AC
MQHKDFATKEEELKIMRFYQNDLNSAKLLINVTHDKVVTDFSTATKVQIAFLKPDGKRVFQDVQNVNQMQGKYYVVLSTQTLIAYGNVIAQLRLTFPNNKVIETCKFVFAVDESIMSDAAMQSTNEFPVIQQAIDAGRKLEGKDIDGIIAAGAKVDAAVKKTGDTMSGTLLVDISGGNKSYGWKKSDGKLHYIYGGDDAVALYSEVSNKSAWKYTPSTDTFDLNAAKTNLLKSTGDTMTGPLTLANELRLEYSTSVQQLLFKGDGKTVKSVWLAKSQEGVVIVSETTPGSGSRDWANAIYIGGSQNNVVKKSGDTMAGTLTLGNDLAELNFSNAKSEVCIQKTSSGNIVMWDRKNQNIAWQYLPDTKTFNIQTASNVVKSSSNNVMHARLDFEVDAPSMRYFQDDGATTNSARGVDFYEGDVFKGGIGRFRNSPTSERYYMGWGSTPWVEANNFTVSATQITYKGKPVAMRDKDGTVNLTLSADGENPNSVAIPVAERRGNTVTISGSVRRKAGATGDVVLTLPVDMRPATTQRMNLLATDGTVVYATISNSSGNLAFSIAGKEVFLQNTFVVN